MPRDGTELLKESRLRGALPSGFKTTLADEDHLRELESHSVNNLDNTVKDYNDNVLTEEDVIETHIQRSLSSFITPERTIELPGTGLEFDRLIKFASYYKADNETPSGTIKTPRDAGPDDIIFSFASPEVYEEVTGQAQDTFEQTGLTGGNVLDLVGDAGVDEGTNQSGNVMTLDDNEMMYFTGDYIDLSNGQSVVTKLQWSDLDGVGYGPEDAVLDTRLSGAHIITAQGGFVKSTADIDAKVYTDGDAEIVPVAYYMAPGTKAPSLV